jgi:hypothetical protein
LDAFPTNGGHSHSQPTRGWQHVDINLDPNSPQHNAGLSMGCPPWRGNLMTNHGILGYTLFSDKATFWKSTTKTERHGMKKWQEVCRFLVALRGSCWDINKLCEGTWVDPPVPQDNCQKIKICAGFTIFRKAKTNYRVLMFCAHGYTHKDIYQIPIASLASRPPRDSFKAIHGGSGVADRVGGAKCGEWRWVWEREDAPMKWLFYDSNGGKDDKATGWWRRWNVLIICSQSGRFAYYITRLPYGMSTPN